MKRQKTPLIHKLFPWLLTVFIFLAFFFLFNIIKKGAEYLATRRDDGERILAQRLEEETSALKARLERENVEELNKLKLGYDETIKRLVAEKIAMKDALERENAGKLNALERESAEKLDALRREAVANTLSRKRETDAIIQGLRQEIDELKNRLERQKAEILDQVEKEKDREASPLIDEFKRDKDRIIKAIEELIHQKKFHDAQKEIARWNIPPLAEETRAVHRTLKEAELFEHARKVPARNIYLNILLYERLSRLNPGKDLYKQKLSFYQARHRKTYGKDRDESECYDRGYLHGRCMILSTLGVPCGLEDEIGIPESCRKGKDAFQGMKAGVASLGK
ncbi:MAG: hypothetical protein GY859_08410 [Desulfobacterales bacterium]|nr:hypothetical protein [Desulfobacterales bacterium]